MHIVAAVVAGLVAGAAFIAAFVIWADEPPIYRVASFGAQGVTIPEGASTNNHNFEPATATIKTGELVNWMNEERIQTSIIIEPACEPAKGDTANVTSSGTYKLLKPGESFTCMFRNVGEYHIHTEPWPWMQGTVSILP